MTMEDASNSDPPPLELSIELLVAIIHATGSNPRNNQRHGFLSQSWQPGNGTSTKLTTSSRFRRVLDALASLCVSCPRGQTFSIGSQVDQRRSSLVITIADNQEVKQETVDYITNVWRILKALSDLCTGNRPKQSHISPGVSGNKYVGDSPEIPRSKQAAILTEELAELVYVFTREKYMKRIRKWWDSEPENQEGLLSFGYTFLKAKEKPLSGEDKIVGDMLFLLRGAINLLRIKSRDWSTIITLMDEVYRLADNLLTKNPYWLDILALSFADDPNKVFPLRRAIEKLTSHHRYFRELTTFAHSLRFRLAFELHLSVQCVPPIPSNQILLPTSTQSWRSLLSQVHTTEQHHINDASLDQLADTLYHYYRSPSFPHCVHSECALVAHYEALRTGPILYVPAFSCIGVSKLSCKPCHMWLTAFNARGGPKFYTRGTHGKWHFPWTPPAIPGWEPPLMDNMVEEFIAYLRERGEVKSERDGIAGSGGARFKSDVGEKVQCLLEGYWEEGLGECGEE